MTISATPAASRLVAFSDLNQEMQRLLRTARTALNRSYSPYSKFRVGAAVLTNKGSVVGGTNVENAAYGEGICAERSAFIRANAQGVGNRCVAIAIVTRNGDSPTIDVSAPCGACRQVTKEFASRSGVEGEFVVVLATTTFNKIVLLTLDDLLPLPFGPENLS